MRINDIIKKKRDGLNLSSEEIRYFVNGYVNDEIPDYQISALLMAIYLNRMNDAETLYLTEAMVDSGDSVDLSKIDGIKVDKHSTGGVGDSITLILGPMVASCGVPFVKMSGRGLGHTGGTLDKLESIENFNVNLTSDEFINISNKINIAICSQTANITPADKKLYSLRDVTGTVENLSLIASSIMSKKLAVKSNAIVLDVKVGHGAFMKTREEALALANEMVKIGNNYGRETVAVLTNMNQPLGRAIGNALEVKEAVEVLMNKGPKDLLELSLELGAHLLILAKRVTSLDEGKDLLMGKINNGQAYEKFLEFVEAQKGNISMIKDLDLMPQAEHIIEVTSKSKGYIKSINAEVMGESALLLGAGRENLDSILDLSAGLILNKKVGDDVSIGDTLVYIHANNLKNIELVKEKILDNYIISQDNIEAENLIIDCVM